MGEGQDDGGSREGTVTGARSRALGARLAVTCAALVVFMLLVAVTTSVSGHHDWEQWTHLVLLALSVLGFVVGLRGRRSGEREMVFVMLAFGSLGLSQLLLGIGAADGLDHAGLDAADGLYALWSVSLLLYLGRRLLARDLLDGFVHLLDAGVITLALVLTLWEQVIAPSMDTAHTSAYAQLSAVLFPALGVYLATITLLHLLVDRSPARIMTFIGLAAIPIGDVIEISGNDPVQAIRVAAPFWILGVASIVVSAGLPAGARLSAGRPTLSRLLIVNFFVVMALWVATWHYIIHSRPATVTSVVVGMLAGLVYGGEHLAAFLQSKQWADRLGENVIQLEIAHVELRALLDDLPEAVVVLSADGRIREANAHLTTLTGLRRDEVLGRTLASLFAHSERAHLVELWNRMQGGESQFTPPVFTFEQPDGTHLLLEADCNVPISHPDRVVVALRNVTERMAEARRLERARERFRLAFHNAPTGMALIAVADGTLVDVNDSLVQMLGRTRYELIGCHVDDVAHPAEKDRSGRLLAEAIDRRQEGYRTEQRFLRGDGATVWARTWVSVMADENDSLAIAHIEDITERRQNEERMQWAATHDGLTGLPNRFSFLDRLGSHLQTAEPGSVAVLFIDLDNFKVVNDSLGHDAGDQLLRAMSERLRAVVRDRDMLGRFGGDEFIVMLRDVGGNYDPYEVANRLRKEISEPVLIDGAEMFVTASIGITVFDRDGVTTSEMLRDADVAMYRAKARGRDCVEVYAPGSHDASVLTLRTTNELRRGIERGEIVPYYQPIVDLTNGNLVGFEVLARWKHPDRGLLSPEQFLPMAEETGLIGEVGESVLRQSLAQLGRWRNNTKRFGDLEISVNLSVRQLADPALVDMVSDALSEAGVSAGALWLEITETALMSDERTATHTLRELRGLGLNLSVDDFGTGYSSLTYLKRFPVKAIKVDRMFVNGLGINDDDTKIVEAVVKLGHSLGLEVIAEGVETPLQLSRLRQIDCDRGQGYLFGRPRPADLIESEYALS